jgi:hypothetical protein
LDVTESPPYQALTPIRERDSKVMIKREVKERSDDKERSEREKWREK